jgi:hypothetical protein
MRAVWPPAGCETLLAPRDVSKHSVIYMCSLVLGTVVVFRHVHVTVWFHYCVTNTLVLRQ